MHSQLDPTNTLKDGPRHTPGFTPFEEQSRASYGFEDHQREQGHSMNPELLRMDRPRQSVDVGAWPDSAPLDSANSGYAAGKGSRFAKFFDGKPRETPPLPKPQTPVGYGSNSSMPTQKQQETSYAGLHGNPTDHRAMDDIFAMLSSSVHVRSPSLLLICAVILLALSRVSDPTKSILRIPRQPVATFRSPSKRNKRKTICTCFSSHSSRIICILTIV